MKTKPIHLLIAAAFFLAVSSSCQKDKSDDPDHIPTFEEKIHSALYKTLKNNGGKGISLAILFPDGQVVRSTAGISQEGIPVTRDMLFSAGSITKMFTATTILRYYEEGLLDLEDSIGRYLPAYNNVDGSVTIRQLLNHTSGTFNVTENHALWQAVYSEPEKIWALDEILENYVEPPAFEKGTDWGYSNTGYIMLRRLIEIMSGSTIAKEYRKHALTPAGLEHTYCYLEEDLPGEVAVGWIDLDNDSNYDKLPHDYLKSFYSVAGGGIFATAEDLAWWIRKLVHDKVILSESSLSEMLTLHIPTDAEVMVDGYGLGIFRFSHDVAGNHEVIGHGGDPPGYAAGALYMEDLGVCIGIADNTEMGNTMPAIVEVMDIIEDYLQK